MSSLIKHPKDFYSGLMYAAIGGGAIVVAGGYNMGTSVRMGPGYFPTILGALLVLVGVISMVRSFTHEGERIKTFSWKEIALVLGSVVLFGLLVRGAGLVLLRQVPRVKRFLAYLPEGPDIDWTGERTGRPLEDWLEPLSCHLKAIGAFAVKMGPMAAVRHWHADTLKAAIADGTAKRLRDVEADETFDDALAVADKLRALGWSQKPDTGAGFGDVQPRYVFQVPLAGRTEADLLFDDEIMDEVPTDPWDEPVDLLVTERGVIERPDAAKLALLMCRKRLH